MNMHTTDLFNSASPLAVDPAAPGLIVDNFCGGGGASTGIEQALGRAVDIAINHDADAIAMHEVNHPGTFHVKNNIWQIDPEAVTGGKPVELAWFSPDCKHFSKAKGGKPREKSIRDLAWVVVLWAQRVRPTLILLENVEEFRTWGPLDDEGNPIKERAGETFKEWTAQLRKEGYRIQWKELRACDYGAPTIRKRFFMIARCDGLPITWPTPTHGKPGSPEVLSGKRLPWRTAAEIIDWSIPCPSIFERERPLAEKTLRRIAHGIMKFVVDNPNPFIVPLTHQGSMSRVYSGDEPLSTVTGANRGELAVAMPYFARTAHGDVDKNGKKRGQPCHGPAEPFPTVTQSQDSALVTPFLSPVKSWGGGGNEARSILEPMRTTTTSKGGEHAIVAAHLVKFRFDHSGLPVTAPLPTITANSYIKRAGGAQPLGVVETRLAPFATYAQQGGNNRELTLPLHTITASRKDQNCIATAVLAPVVVGTAFKNTRALRAFEATEPLRTQTAQPEYGIAAAHLIRVGNGERDGQAPRAVDVQAPLHTVVAQRNNHALVAALMQKFADNGKGYDPSEPIHTVMAGAPRHAVVTAHMAQFNTNPGDRVNPGHSVESPVSTVATKGPHQAVVTSHMMQLRGTCQHGRPTDEPLATLTANGNHAAEVRAFLIKYFGTDQDPRLEEPLHTITSKHRFGLVTVTIGGEEYVIVDIGMRMLTPRELFNAQGFPADYQIDRDAQGRPMTKTSQVARCGNSVCPPLSRALVEANAPSLIANGTLDLDDAPEAAVAA